MPSSDPEKLTASRARADAKRAGKRSRGWACIVYPESAPGEWVDALRDQHVQILISPLHDGDVTADGKPKKRHYHVLMMADQPVTEATARAVFAAAGVTAPPELVRSIRAYARYLVHMDDHDKHPYDPSDVQELSGASWSAVALDETEERDRILTEIEDWLDEQGCLSYRQLCRYARSERPEWVHVIRTSTIHLSAYVRSAQWEVEQEQRRRDARKSLRRDSDVDWRRRSFGEPGEG